MAITSNLHKPQYHENPWFKNGQQLQEAAANVSHQHANQSYYYHLLSVFSKQVLAVMRSKLDVNAPLYQIPSPKRSIADYVLEAA